MAMTHTSGRLLHGTWFSKHCQKFPPIEVLTGRHLQGSALTEQPLLTASRLYPAICSSRRGWLGSSFLELLGQQRGHQGLLLGTAAHAMHGPGHVSLGKWWQSGQGDRPSRAEGLLQTEGSATSQASLLPFVETESIKAPLHGFQTSCG